MPSELWSLGHRFDADSRICKPRDSNEQDPVRSADGIVSHAGVLSPRSRLGVGVRFAFSGLAPAAICWRGFAASGGFAGACRHMKRMRVRLPSCVGWQSRFGAAMTRRAADSAERVGNTGGPIPVVRTLVSQPGLLWGWCADEPRDHIGTTAEAWSEVAFPRYAARGSIKFHH